MEREKGTDRRLNKTQEDELQPALHATLQNLLTPLPDPLLRVLAGPTEEVVNLPGVPTAADPSGVDVGHVVWRDDLFEARDERERERLLGEGQEELSDLEDNERVGGVVGGVGGEEGRDGCPGSLGRESQKRKEEREDGGDKQNVGVNAGAEGGDHAGPIDLVVGVLKAKREGWSISYARFLAAKKGRTRLMRALTTAPASTPPSSPWASTSAKPVIIALVLSWSPSTPPHQRTNSVRRACTSAVPWPSSHRNSGRLTPDRGRGSEFMVDPRKPAENLAVMAIKSDLRCSPSSKGAPLVDSSVDSNSVPMPGLRSVSSSNQTAVVDRRPSIAA